MKRVRMMWRVERKMADFQAGAVCLGIATLMFVLLILGLEFVGLKEFGHYAIAGCALVFGVLTSFIVFCMNRDVKKLIRDGPPDLLLSWVKFYGSPARFPHADYERKALQKFAISEIESTMIKLVRMLDKQANDEQALANCREEFEKAKMTQELESLEMLDKFRENVANLQSRVNSAEWYLNQGKKQVSKAENELKELVSLFRALSMMPESFDQGQTMQCAKQKAAEEQKAEAAKQTQQANDPAAEPQQA